MNIETAAQSIVCALQRDFEIGTFDGENAEFYSASDFVLEKTVMDVLKKILEKEKIT